MFGKKKHLSGKVALRNFLIRFRIKKRRAVFFLLMEGKKRSRNVNDEEEREPKEPRVEEEVACLLAMI